MFENVVRGARRGGDGPPHDDPDDGDDEAGERVKILMGRPPLKSDSREERERHTCLSGSLVRSILLSLSSFSSLVSPDPVFAIPLSIKRLRGNPVSSAVDLLLPLNRLPTCTDSAPDAGYDELRLLIFHSSHTISSSRVSLPVTPLSLRLAPHQ